MIWSDRRSDEWPGLPVGPGDQAVDSRLKVDDRGEHAAFQPTLDEPGEDGLDGIQPSIAARSIRCQRHAGQGPAREEDVGVKRKVQRGWLSSQAWTFGCVGCAVVQERMDQLSGGRIPLSGFGPGSTIPLDYTASQPWRPS